MKKNKCATFSDAPSWYNKRQRVKYERDKRLTKIEINMVERMAKAKGIMW